jgi:hypothetical protein
MPVWNELVAPRIKRVIVRSVVIGLVLLSWVNVRLEQRVAQSIGAGITHVVCEETVKPLAERVLALIQSSLPKAARSRHMLCLCK